MRPYGRLLLAISIARSAMGFGALIVLSLDVLWGPWAALGLFALGQITDHLDGWIARKWSTPNLLGYLQDSISDKLFHCGFVLGLSQDYIFLQALFWGVLCREFVVLASRIITPPVETRLQSLKIWSILYAGLLRISVFTFLITYLVPLSIATGMAFLAYGLLCGALLIGAIGVMKLGTESPKGE